MIILKKYSLLLLLGNAILSLLLILVDSDFGIFHYSISIILFTWILFQRKNNIIFLIRTFFLGIVGYLAYTVKLIDSTAYFSFHMFESQTYEITLLMFLLTNMALASSEMGIIAGSKMKIKKYNSKHIVESKIFFYFISLLLILVSLLYLKSSYAMGMYGSEISAGGPLGNLNTIINILFFITIFLYYKRKNLLNKNNKLMIKTLVSIFLFVYIFVEFLHGIRMPALNGIIGIFVLYQVYNNGSLEVKIKYLIPISVLYVIVQFVGLVRTNFDRMENINLIDLLYRSSENTGILLNQGTINNIAATFSGTIMLLKNDLIDFYYGRTYFEYLLRTPPKFIYPGRPDDFSLEFERMGLTSGGGFFELAEAYLNFWAFGALIVPFFLSFVISYAYKSFIYNKYSLKHSIMLFSILAVYLRGLMYQTFALYKSVFTGFIIFLIVYTIYIVFKGNMRGKQS